MDVPYELFLDELHNHDRLIYKQTRLALNKKIHTNLLDTHREGVS